MAAKVVMVAVPAVLGVASIRVYTVSEAPADGLITREKMNIYTPLPQSAQVRFVPERPGAIESGFTTVRESILPFVQAVKGACVSVRRGSVNLYHAGEDVYYYLKDPPPGFIPRVATITMAGLLGMFLARKGSRFKRLVLPLGLMSAGVSVCYPAQAITVLKVTGKKVYAAGQWSSAAGSSLLSSVPQEPGAKESAPVPKPESAVVWEASGPGSAQRAAVPEAEVKSAESVPVSDEPIVTVTTEEASSVTLSELSPVQPPTETSTDPVAHSLPTETTTTSENLPTPAEFEAPSEAKQSPEANLSLEPKTAASVPGEPAPAPKLSDGSGFKPEPSLMDFGQSSPEDEDLYSTRS
uniref:MICOS complex subunit n=1 Tax=Monopterus albus TaxID=43700 RepID=A0A3Q3JJK8_MONAL|nr:MICOS complex subunit MIC27 isoform X2 [Monopterus albus]